MIFSLFVIIFFIGLLAIQVIWILKKGILISDFWTISW